MNNPMKYDDCVFKTSCDVDKFVKHKFREEFRKKFKSLLNNLQKICSSDPDVNELLYEEDILILHKEDLSKLIENFKYELQVTYFS